MALKDVFKVSVKTFFNPAAWLGTKELKAYNRIIYDILKQTFSVDRPLRSESFEQALKRQHVTDAELKRIANSYAVNKMVFYALSFLSFCVSFYYLIHHHTFSGWLLCIAVTALFFSQAFRYSFWQFQIRQRKLGCTFNEWWNGKTQDAKD